MAGVAHFISSHEHSVKPSLLFLFVWLFPASKGPNYSELIDFLICFLILFLDLFQ